MTRDELLALPPAVDVPTAADVLGIGRTCAYELIRTGGWPTPVLRIGRLIRIPTAPLLDLVGVARLSGGRSDVVAYAAPQRTERSYRG